ncbi:MAG: hypothetical protein ACO3LE_08100, partial [Bdellovibrionota bacterium]
MRSFAIKRFATQFSLASMLLTGAAASYDFNLYAQAVTSIRHQQALTDAMLRSLFEEGDDIKAANDKSYKNNETVLNLGVLEFPLSTKTLVENGYYLDQNGWVRRTQDGKNSKSSPQDRSFLAAEIAIDAFSFDPGASGANLPPGIAQNQNFQQIQNYVMSEAYVNPLVSLYNAHISAGGMAFLDKSKIYNLEDIESRKKDSSFTIGSGAGSITYAFTRIQYDDSWFVKDPRVISVEITTSTGEKKYRLINKDEHRLIMDYLNFMKDKDPELAKVLKKFKSEGIDKWNQETYDLAFEKGVERIPNQYQFNNGQWIGFSSGGTSLPSGSVTMTSGSGVQAPVSGGAASGNIVFQTGSPQFNSGNPQFVNVSNLGVEPQMFSVQTQQGPMSYAVLPLANGGFVFLQPMQASDGSTYYRLLTQPEHDAMINYLRNNASGQPATILSLINANPNYNQAAYHQALQNQISFQPVASPAAPTNAGANVQFVPGGAPMGQGATAFVTAAPGAGLTSSSFYISNIKRDGETLVMFYEPDGSKRSVWMTDDQLLEFKNVIQGAGNSGAVSTTTISSVAAPTTAGAAGSALVLQPIAGQIQNPDAKAILLQVLDSQNRSLYQDRIDLEQGTSLSVAQALIEAAKQEIIEQQQE